MKHYLFLFVCLITFPSLSQDGLVEGFNDNTLNGWTANASIYSLSEENQQLKVAVTKTTDWDAFTYGFPAMNVSLTPYVKVRVKTAGTVQFRIDMRDATGKITNQTAVVKSLSGSSNWQELTFDFTGMFYQQYPTTAAGPVDATQINGLVMTANPGGDYTGTFYLDSLLIGTATGILPPPGGIHLNQIGFYPDMIKKAVVTDTSATMFYVTESTTEDTVYTGVLGPKEYWSHSAENLRMAEFTEFNVPGFYKILVPEVGYSHEFEIREAVHLDVAKAALKSYYYQRASTELKAEHAGTWARPAGHPDNNVYVHASAATEARPAGTVISAPRGWYDAGDYGKYVVNSGISTYQILSLYEHFPAYFDTLNLNIPESNNGVPDVLDEALWNVRWMLDMQDLDGGVYHKLTGLNFDGNVMPHVSTSARYVIGKSTAATLNFAAVMAQAARIFKHFETEFPQLADSMLTAAINAHAWAEANPSANFTANPTGVSTGAYDDGNPSDEFLWAETELLISTYNPDYWSSGLVGFTANIPGWRDVKTLGLVSLVHNRKTVHPFADTAAAKTRLLSYAKTLLDHQSASAYDVSMGIDNWNFVWGSNAVAGNQGMLLLQGFRLTGDSAYYKAAINNLDYILGRNATNYSFVSGHGDNASKNIHHRPSAADGIDGMVPGFVAGGPHSHSINDCSGASYPSSLRAKMYLDAYCSYSTNENAINYSSAFSYLVNGVEALRLGGADYIALSNKNSVQEIAVSVFPNPAKGSVSIKADMNQGMLTITDISGKIKFQEAFAGKDFHQVNIENLEPGMYILKLDSDKGSGAKKLIVR